MENTLENKAKFFAQYWGQDVYRIKNGIDEPGRNIIGNDYVAFIELKPLSSITDEDLLKIAELLIWRKSMQESSIIVQTKELLLSQSQTNLYRENWSDIVDKVRELGYAHKWNGISVEKQIEYGWVKIKQV